MMSYYGHTEVCDTPDNWYDMYAQALTIVAACKENIIADKALLAQALTLVAACKENITRHIETTLAEQEQTMKEVIEKYAYEIDRIIVAGTAGDRTWEGLLCAFYEEIQALERIE